MWIVIPTKYTKLNVYINDIRWQKLTHLRRNISMRLRWNTNIHRYMFHERSPVWQKETGRAGRGVWRQLPIERWRWGVRWDWSRASITSPKYESLYVLRSPQYETTQPMKRPTSLLALSSRWTRRVISETKAIMSPPVCHWMESIFFVEGGEIVI